MFDVILRTLMFLALGAFLLAVTLMPLDMVDDPVLRRRMTGVTVALAVVLTVLIGAVYL